MNFASIITRNFRSFSREFMQYLLNFPTYV